MSIVARLSAKLIADTAGYESGLARASRSTNTWKNQTNSALGMAGRSFDNFNTHVEKSVGGIIDLRGQLGYLATAAAGALSVQKIIQYSGAWTDLTSRVNNAAGSMQQGEIVMGQLEKMARRTYTSLNQTAETYLLNSTAMRELGYSTQQTLDYVESINNALVISGAKGQRAESVMNALSKAMALGKLSGENLNTVISSGGRVAEALARGMGVTVSELRKLGTEGKITGKEIFGITKELGTLREEAEAMPATVADAFVILDNAFLGFIGRTEAIKNGTGSLASLILFMADNFEYLAKTVLAVAGVFAAKLLTSLGSYITSTVVATARTATFTYTLGTMAFGSRAAAVGMTALAGATTLLSGAIAFLGGPLGVAILGTMVMMRDATNAAADAQLRLNEQIAEHRASADAYMDANEDMRRATEERTKAALENYKMELEAILRIQTALAGENKLFRAARTIGSALGIDTSAQDVAALAENIKKEIAALEGDLQKFEDIRSGKITRNSLNNTDSDKKKKDVYKEVIARLQEESKMLEIQTGMYGQKASAITKAQQAQRIQNQITAAGIKLTKEQQEEIARYLDSIEKQTDLQEKQARQQKLLQEQERDRQQALNQLGSTFESNFEKAILDGEKLSDVLNNLLNDILKIMTRVTITAPLGNAITDALTPKSGGGGGFLSDLFGWLPSFDVGTNFVPRDMIAQIHKGEMIVPAYDAERLRNGGAGGEVTVNIINNTPSTVSQSQSQGANGMELNVVIDQAVAENINRPGSATREAMKTFSSRSLVRR